MNRIPSWLLVSLVAMSGILFTTSGCQPKAEPTRETIADEMPSLSPVDLSEGERLQVIATTSIVADVVGEVGRDRIDLTQILFRRQFLTIQRACAIRQE